MNTLGEEVKEYLDDFRAADTERTGMRDHALMQFFKWKAIKEGIRKIDMEASG